MTTLVMNYTVNPIWSALKRFGKHWVETQESVGRAKAAQHLAAMGYYEEAKELMLDLKRSKNS